MKSITVSEKMLSHKKKKKKNHHQNAKKNRFLITVNVLGSAGPIRFVVNEDDSVAGIIDSALKLYAREGRLPLLGFDGVALSRKCRIGCYESLGSDRVMPAGKNHFAVQEAEAEAEAEAEPSTDDRSQV